MADPFEGLQPVFATRLQQMISDARAQGVTIGVGSGFRTVDEQIALRKKNGCPDVWRSPASSCRVPTAIPGRSNHNQGLAADLTGDKAWANRNAAKYGLAFNVNGEDWHVELADGQGVEGHNANWQSETMDPEQELRSRLDKIMGIISGGGPTTPEGQVAQAAQTSTTVAGIPEDEPVAAAAIPTAVNAAAGAVAGKGVERWRPMVIQAMQYVGEPVTEQRVQMVLRRMKQESSGNATAVNRTDVNAKRGDPSVGLMQVIGATFRAHAGELAARGQTDPFANLVASMRYAKKRYGSLEAAYNRKGGY